ncbi:MAG: SHOCT domain-containing protein [Peptoniphilaceae bacterium]|nr:SHOCT domain-containing protein [Peptoniphilaceae bacterium]
MLALKTAEEMYQYCKDNNLGTGTSKGWAIKHFQLLIDNLKPDETVYCVFIGLHNYKSMTKHDNNYAYAMTNKRLIMAQHKLLGANVQSVNIENINDITLSKTGIAGMGIGTVCIDTFKETFNVGVNVSSAGNIYERAHEVWDIVRAQKADSQVTRTGVQNAKSPAEQIKEYKELLDMGILTQEEFDSKKKELLGL